MHSASSGDIYYTANTQTLVGLVFRLGQYPFKELLSFKNRYLFPPG